MDRQRVLCLVLAGGAGTRLGPLTADRAKSAVPFGGLYRVVDFALTNLVNSGLRRIYVLTQYKSHSLNRHITTTWRLSNLLDNYVTPVPAQQRLGPRWQTGSADAIYQSLNLIHADRPDIVVVAGADHVYRMDLSQMVEAHVAWGAGATVAAIPVARKEATQFGVVQAAPDGRLIEFFMEKPSDPPGRPGVPDRALVSMGNYVFDTDVLVEALHKDAADRGQPAQHGRRHHPDPGPGARRVRLRLPAEQGARCRAARHGLLAGDGDHRLLFRCAHGPVRGPPDVQPVQPRVADPDLRTPRPAGQVRA